MAEKFPGFDAPVIEIAIKELTKLFSATGPLNPAAAARMREVGIRLDEIVKKAREVLKATNEIAQAKKLAKGGINPAGAALAQIRERVQAEKELLKILEKEEAVRQRIRAQDASSANKRLTALLDQERKKPFGPLKADIQKRLNAEEENLRRAAQRFKKWQQTRAKIEAGADVKLAEDAYKRRIAAEKKFVQALQATQGAVVRFSKEGALHIARFGTITGNTLNRAATHFASFGLSAQRAFAGLSQRIAFIGRTLPTSLGNLFRGITGGGGLAGFGTAPIRIAGRMASAVGVAVARSVDAAISTSADLVSKALSAGGHIFRAGVTGISKFVGDLATSVSKLFGSLFGKGGKFMASFSGFLKAVPQLFGNIAGGLAKGASSVLGGFVNLGASAAQAFAQGIVGAVQTIGGIAEAILSIGSNLLGGLIQFSADLAEKFVRSLTQAITVSLAASLGTAIVLGVKSAKVDRIIAQTVALNPGSAQGQFAKFQKIGSEAAKTFGLGFEEAFRGLRTVVAQGFTDAAEASDIFQAAVELSAASGGSLETAVEALARSFRLYGKEVGSAKAFSDKFFVAAARGSAEVEDFAANMGKVLGQARAMNINFDALTATLSTATNVLRPEAAFIGLSTALSDLVSPTKKAIETLEELGVTYSVVDFDLLKFLEDLKKAGATAKDIDNIFEQRSSRGILALIPRLKELRENYQEISKAQGQTVRTANELVQKSPAQAFARLQATVRSASQELFSLAKIPLANAIDAITRAVEGLHTRIMEFVESESFKTFVADLSGGVQRFGAAASEKLRGVSKIPGAFAREGVSGAAAAANQVPLFRSIVQGLLDLKTTLLTVGTNLLGGFGEYIEGGIKKLIEFSGRSLSLLRSTLAEFITPIFKILSLTAKFQVAAAGYQIGGVLGKGLGAGLDKLARLFDEIPLLKELGSGIREGAAIAGAVVAVEEVEALTKEVTESMEAVTRALSGQFKSLVDTTVREIGASTGKVANALQEMTLQASEQAAAYSIETLKIETQAEKENQKERNRVEEAGRWGRALGSVPLSARDNSRGPAAPKGRSMEDQLEMLRAEMKIAEGKREHKMEEALGLMRPMNKFLGDIAQRQREQLDELKFNREKTVEAINTMRDRVSAIVQKGNEALGSIHAALVPKEPKLPQEVRQALRHARRAQEKREKAILSSSLRRTSHGLFGIPTVATDLPSIFGAKAEVGRSRLGYTEGMDAMDKEAAFRLVKMETLGLIMDEEIDARRELVFQLKDMYATLSSITSGVSAGKRAELTAGLVDKAKALGVDTSKFSDMTTLRKGVLEKLEFVSGSGISISPEDRDLMARVKDEVLRSDVPSPEEVTEKMGKIPEGAGTLKEIDSMIAAKEAEMAEIDVLKVAFDDLMVTEGLSVEQMIDFLSGVESYAGDRAAFLKTLVDKLQRVQKSIESLESDLSRLSKKVGL